ncbi:MAG TPA: type II secretion system protein, partial [Anaerohalosphaeraceae bacterium]|nr:type II secretion system protein [Anaerohalosphaeraceae bacterium]
MNRKSFLPKIHGFTLIEMMIVVAILAIPLVAVGILAAGGSRSFRQTYNSIHKEVRQDAVAVMTAFGTVSRQSNRNNYKVYTIKNGVYAEAQPPPKQEIASGQAVEFRYWQDPFDPEHPGENALDISNTGTHYALFYLDGSELKVDYGTVDGDVAGIVGSSRSAARILRTVTLTRFVDLSKTTDLFSHSIIGGAGQGSVRLNLTLADEEG